MQSVISFSLSVLKAQKVAVILTALVIGLGTTGFLSIRLLTARIEASVFAGARDALGGDLALTLARPIPDAGEAELLSVVPLHAEKSSLRKTRVSEGLSMASRPTDAQGSASAGLEAAATTLVEVVAVGDGFPLLSGPVTLPEGALKTLDENSALIDTSLAEQLYGGTETALDQPVMIGALTFRVGGFIVEDPGREPRSLVTGPRVYIRRSSAVIERLFSDRSRVRDSILLAFDQTAPGQGEPSGADSKTRPQRGPDVETLADALEQKALQGTLEGLRVRTASEHAYRLFQPLKRFTGVVELTSLAALLVSLFGAAFSIRHLVRLLGPQVALLRALGATHRAATLPVWILTGLALLGGLTIGTTLAQAFGLSVLSTVLGRLSGSQAPDQAGGGQTPGADLLAQLSSGLSTGESLAGAALTVGAVWALTIVVVLAAVWPALQRALSLPPLRVLEDASALTEAEPRQRPPEPAMKGQATHTAGKAPRNKTRVRRMLEAGLAPALVTAVSVYWIVGDLQTVLISAGALFALLLSLYAITRLLFALFTLLVPRFSPEVQVSLLSALRNRSQYQHFVVTLGFALTLAFFVGLLSGEFLGPLESSTDTDRPNMFFLDVQSSQREAFERGLTEQFGVPFQTAPIVRARIAAINDKPVSSLLKENAGYDEPRRGRRDRLEDEDGDNRRRFLQREQNLSYVWEIDPSTISAGVGWPALSHSDALRDRRAEVSLEERFARRLGVGLGDALTFSVQGVDVTARVTSLRSVRWESGQINFFAVLHPSLLVDAPQQHIVAAHVAASPTRDTPQADFGNVRGPLLPSLTAWLHKDFPNVTFIDVRAVAQKVTAVIQRMVEAVKLISALCLFTALLIFSITLVHLRSFRARDVALLRLLGGRNSAIKRGWAAEYCVIGAVATLSALVLAVSLCLGWTLYTFSEWPRLRVFEPLLLAATAVGLSTMLGVLASRSLMSRQPLESLRSAEETGL